MQVFGPAAVDGLSSLGSTLAVMTLPEDGMTVLLEEGPLPSGKGEDGPGAGAMLQSSMGTFSI